MASTEPSWARRLRAYRAENNAQFGVRGPSPQEILASGARPAVPGRIRGLSQRQMYDSNLAARGGDPEALQRGIERRRVKQQTDDDAAAVEEMKLALRGQRGEGVAATIEAPAASPAPMVARGAVRERAGFETADRNRFTSRRTLRPSTFTDDDGEKLPLSEWKRKRAAKFDGF